MPVVRCSGPQGKNGLHADAISFYKYYALSILLVVLGGSSALEIYRLISRQFSGRFVTAPIYLF